MTEAFFFDPCCNLQKLRQQCCATRLFPIGCLARSQERNLRMMTVISRLDFSDVTFVFSCEILVFFGSLKLYQFMGFLCICYMLDLPPTQ